MARNDANDDLTTELEKDENGFCTLQVQTKRGEGTRDEDRIKATLGRNSVEEIEADRDEFLTMVEETMARRRAANHSEDDESED